MAVNMQITVIDVSASQFVKTNRGGYNFVEIAYKKDGKVEGKKIMDFGHDAAKAVFGFVKDVKAGDVLNVTLEKVNDYWTWVGVSSEGNTNGAGSPVSADAPAAPVAGSPAKAGRVVGSNYETSDERAIRQRLIVRQSSITAALTLLIHNQPKTSIDPNVMLAMADAFTDWVFKTDGVKALAQMKDDTV